MFQIFEYDNKNNNEDNINLEKDKDKERQNIFGLFSQNDKNFENVEKPVEISFLEKKRKKSEISTYIDFIGQTLILGWDDPLTDCSQMFGFCDSYSYIEIEEIDFSNFDFSQVR